MSDEDTTNTIEMQDEAGAIEAPLYRQSSPDLLVFRDEEGSDPVVEGRVVPYNEWSEVDSVMEGHFMERFAEGALTKTIAERRDRQQVYFEHGKSKIFDYQPIAELRETWEQPDGVYFRAALLDGLPDLFRDGLRRGLYGASIGAKVIQMARARNPQKSDHNPERLEERTYKEVRAFDFSITPRPHYSSTMVALRSINDDLVMERLLAEPERLLELISRTKPQTEPPHSEHEDEAEEPVRDRSRSTQPVRDYLQPQEDERSWRL